MSKGERIHTEENTGLKRKRITEYLNRYVSQVSTPATLDGGGQGLHYFDSDKSIVTDRTLALEAYLIDNQHNEHNYSWGRTILAEIWTCNLLQLAYPQITDKRNLQVRLVPTDLDGTHDYERVEGLSPELHQKGADIMLYKKNHAHQRPLLLIDVTIGNKNTVDRKRKRLPLQAEMSVPVATLALNNLAIYNHWEARDEELFMRFLDCHAKESIHTGSQPDDIVFKKAMKCWMTDFHKKFGHALDECEQGFIDYEHKPYPFPERIKIAQNKLKTARKILKVSYAD